jgi:hypothetical protein
MHERWAVSGFSRLRGMLTPSVDTAETCRCVGRHSWRRRTIFVNYAHGMLVHPATVPTGTRPRKAHYRMSFA